jgi:hypothetical protein
MQSSKKIPLGQTVADNSGGGSAWIVISANKTAVNDEQYSNVANATYTDPAPVEGKGYVVKVVNGTATIGGVGYTEGKIVTRTYHSGSWRSKSYVDETIIGSATQTALDAKENLSNKATDLTSPDNTKYPTTLAIQNALDSINFNIESVLENEILENGLVYQVPNIDGSYSTGVSSQYLRLANAPTTQNALTSGTFGLSCGVLSTTASAGGIAFIRRNDALQLQLYTNVVTIREFTVDSAITSGCRYFTGWSKNFQFSTPTNIEPDLQTECILVAKLSTSNNLQILHNDNTGTCTSIALGANFPANSTLYKYRVILQRISATDYNIQVIRKTLSDGTLLLSSIYNLTTDLPTTGGSPLQQIHFITNNADATDMRLGDYGLIVKKISI